MWNMTFAPPHVIQARVLTRLPDSFRNKRRAEWTDANKPGHEIDSFLEGPSFDRELDNCPPDANRIQYGL